MDDVEDYLHEREGFEEVEDQDIEESPTKEQAVERTAEEALVVPELFEETPELLLELLLFRVVEARVVVVDEESAADRSYNTEPCKDEGQSYIENVSN